MSDGRTEDELVQQMRKENFTWINISDCWLRADKNTSVDAKPLTAALLEKKLKSIKLKFRYLVRLHHYHGDEMVWRINCEFEDNENTVTDMLMDKLEDYSVFIVENDTFLVA